MRKREGHQKENSRLLLFQREKTGCELELFAELKSWIKAAGNYVCYYLYRADCDEIYRSHIGGFLPPKDPPFPQTWANLVAIDKVEFNRAKDEKRSPKSLKLRFLQHVPVALKGLTRRDWEELEGFYRKRRAAFFSLEHTG